MATFTPFMQGSKAQSIIDGYLNNGGYSQAQPEIDLNSAGNFRNPIFDLRTEQENAGTLTPEDLYPNSQIDFSAPDTPVDPCPEGFMLVDGVCQPIETFGQSMYQEDNDRDDPEERPYYSIDAMKELSDEEFLDYMTSGVLGNSLLGYLPSKGSQVTIKPNLMPPLFKLAFGGQDKLRKDFMMSELMKRGYFTGNFDKNQNPIFDIANKNINTNVGGIESQLPQNVQGQPVTDVFGDTYQQVTNDGQGSTGYSFTSNDPSLPNVEQETQSGVKYGAGRGTSIPSGGTGTPPNYSGNPFIAPPPQFTYAQQQYEEDYDK